MLNSATDMPTRMLLWSHVAYWREVRRWWGCYYERRASRFQGRLAQRGITAIGQYAAAEAKAEIEALAQAQQAQAQAQAQGFAPARAQLHANMGTHASPQTWPPSWVAQAGPEAWTETKTDTPRAGTGAGAGKQPEAEVGSEDGAGAGAGAASALVLPLSPSESELLTA